MISRDFKVMYVNRSGAAALGMSQEDLVGKGLNELFPREDVEKMERGLLKVFESGKAFSEELTHRFIHGDLNTHVSLNPILDDNGKVGSVMGVSRNVNDLKKAEERYRILIENAPLGIFTCDLNGQITSINPKILELVGSKSQEFTRSINLLNFEPLVKSGLTEGVYERIIKGESMVAEGSYRSYWGKSLYLQFHLTPLRDSDGKISGTLGIIEDTTGRKQAEEVLRTTLQRFYTILSSTYGAILLVSEEDRVEYANEMFCRYFNLHELPASLVGISATELINKIKGAYYDPGRAVARIAEIIERWEPVIGEEISLRDGRTCLRDFIPLSIDGKRYGRLWHHTDITDIKRAEEELTNAKAYAELYVDLMGHDINNLNQVARGYLELIDGMAEDKGIKQFVSKSMEAIDSSSRLIDNVRKLQRGRYGNYQPEIYDLGELIEEVAAQFMPRPDGSADIACDTIKGIRVKANELLRDVFSNLIDNAIKHSGGPTLIKIRMLCEEKNGRQYCSVTIEDNGTGIPDDMKDKVFSRMQRGSTKAKGSGLGLYLVRSLVDSYGGEVWAEDRVPGEHAKGARFVVLLPASYTAQGRQR